MQTYIQKLPLLFRFLGHLEGKLIIYGDRLFAKDVFSGAQRVHSNRIMRVVGRKDIHRVNLFVGKRELVIRNDVFDEIGIFVLLRLCFASMTSQAYFTRTLSERALKAGKWALVAIRPQPTTAMQIFLFMVSNSP